MFCSTTLRGLSLDVTLNVPERDDTVAIPKRGTKTTA